MARPTYEPTEASRKTATSMLAYGIKQEDIAIVLDIDPKTFRKHYGDEIAKAHVQANSRVAETAYQMATSGRHPAMTMFWLKTRLGWREVERIDINFVRERATELARELGLPEAEVIEEAERIIAASRKGR